MTFHFYIPHVAFIIVCPANDIDDSDDSYMQLIVHYLLYCLYVLNILLAVVIMYLIVR